MKIAMLGTGPFAVPTLRRLARSHHEVVQVVTRPPRGRRPVPSPMEQAALQEGIPLWQPETLNDAEAQDALRQLGPDLLVVCDYGEILSAATLAVAPLGGVNLHASLLPKYRGAAPVQWALLNGEIETGNTVIEMTPGLDAGPCLGVQRVAIDPDESAGVLEGRLAMLGADLVLDVVNRLASGDRRGVAQDPLLRSKAPRLRKEQGSIDWSMSAQQIHNQVRAFDPWPRTWTWRPCEPDPPQRLIVHKTGVIRENFSGCEGLPGTLLEAGPRLVVRTGQGVLELLQVQPEGKKAMSADEFLRGRPLDVGERLASG